MFPKNDSDCRVQTCLKVNQGEPAEIKESLALKKTGGRWDMGKSLHHVTKTAGGFTASRVTIASCGFPLTAFPFYQLLPVGKQPLYPFPSVSSCLPSQTQSLLETTFKWRQISLAVSLYTHKIVCCVCLWDYPPMFQYCHPLKIG